MKRRALIQVYISLIAMLVVSLFAITPSLAKAGNGNPSPVNPQNNPPPEVQQQPLVVVSLSLNSDSPAPGAGPFWPQVIPGNHWSFPVYVTQGARSTMIAIIKNDGKAKSAPTQVQLIVGKSAAPPYLPQTTYATKTVPVLAPGASMTLEWSFSMPYAGDITSWVKFL